MDRNAKSFWINKISAVLSFPLTVIFVSFSSLKIMGEDNSFVDILLACIVYLGFVNLFNAFKKLMNFL
ncbi:Microcin H47 immunity protein MchI [Klebsiella spallanzanii]|uniref:Microcin H47 immunity protein MchI n=1 Tax=Klebsiella spallanzanii TaxID=2587528 RepID=A0ABY6V502_9ENTR|nr:hypothetical protein [Klebsiella spallanzanii]VUS22614.1 Microcin H47 immunity protein MchI [Klebsiella spallanzanii]